MVAGEMTGTEKSGCRQTKTFADICCKSIIDKRNTGMIEVGFIEGAAPLYLTGTMQKNTGGITALGKENRTSLGQGSRRFKTNATAADIYGYSRLSNELVPGVVCAFSQAYKETTGDSPVPTTILKPVASRTGYRRAGDQFNKMWAGGVLSPLAVNFDMLGDRQVQTVLGTLATSILQQPMGARVYREIIFFLRHSNLSPVNLLNDCGGS